MNVQPSPAEAAELLPQAGIHAAPLLAYVYNRLIPSDYGRGVELARMSWAAALGSLQLHAESGYEEDIPVWLAHAARRTIREQVSPAHRAQRVTTVTKTPAAPATASPAVIPIAA